MARRMPCSTRSSGVRKRSSFSRWFEITGLPVCSAKPAGEARSAPTLASPTMPGGQPTPARISSRFSAGRCSSTLENSARRPSAANRAVRSSSSGKGVPLSASTPSSARSSCWRTRWRSSRRLGPSGSSPSGGSSITGSPPSSAPARACPSTRLSGRSFTTGDAFGASPCRRGKCTTIVPANLAGSLDAAGRVPPSMRPSASPSRRPICRRSLAHRNGTHDGPARSRPRPRRRELHGARHRGAGGAGAGAAPAGHVCRRHRRARAAPSRGRGAGQRHGRGGGRPRHPHRARARRPQPDHRARQWPRHPDRPAPQVPGQECARGHHDHAALGREVRQQGLRDLGRPARRRRLGGQRARQRARGRGRAQPRRSTSRATRAACRWGRWRRPAAPPTGAAPR